MAFYQCFKTTDRTTYCSSTKYRSHAEGSQWISQCLTAHNLQANEIQGKPWEANTQPARATVWP